MPKKIMTPNELMGKNVYYVNNGPFSVHTTSYLVTFIYTVHAPLYPVDCIFKPTFWKPKTFKVFFFLKFWPYVRLVFKSGLWWRAYGIWYSFNCKFDNCTYYLLNHLFLWLLRPHIHRKLCMIRCVCFLDLYCLGLLQICSENKNIFHFTYPCIT